MTTPIQPALGLDVNGLRVVYDDFVAVADSSFCVAPGESFGIVGESGSGKSTVLRALCILAPKASGTVRLFGEGDAPQPAPGSKAFITRSRSIFVSQE